MKDITIQSDYDKYKLAGINDTTRFLLPSVLVSSATDKALPISYLKKFGFINAYIDDFGLDYSEFEWYNTKENYLFILFSIRNKKNFLPNEEALKEFSSWVDYYDIEDNQDFLTMHVFKIKDKYKPSIEAFKKSQFSKIQHELVKKYNDKLAVGIVFKQNWVKEEFENTYDIKIPSHQEYYRGIHFDKEYFRYDGRFDEKK